MENIFSRIFENMVGRIGGPLNFRIVLQPLVAIIFAIRDGVKDAHEGRGAYFWDLFPDPAHRRELIRSGWKSVGKVFAAAFVIDAIYQFMELHWFYPGEALLTALILAIIPYVLLRGPVNRLTPRKRQLDAHARKDR